MQKRRHKVWLLVGVLVGVTVTTLIVTSPSCEPTPTGITREEAINIAIQKVEGEGEMSLEGRDTEVVEEADCWHIYFPHTSHEIQGGEPHVLVDKGSGNVTRVYYTQ